MMLDVGAIGMEYACGGMRQESEMRVKEGKRREEVGLEKERSMIGVRVLCLE